MANLNLTSELKDSIDKAQSVYVLMPEHSSFDMTASGLALYHALKQAGKTVFIASPSRLNEDALQLPGAQSVSDEVGNRNLVITLQLNHHEDIDKVSYHVNEEEHTFNLVIQPKADVDPITRDNIEYSYTGANADVVMLVGAQRFEDFGVFYELERKLFTESQTIALNRITTSTFANHHLNLPESSSLSEMVFQMLDQLNLAEINGETATVLMAGLDYATNQLQSPTIRPETFETVARLIRAGAQRGVAPASAPTMPAPTFGNQPSPFGPSGFGTSPMMPSSNPSFNNFGNQPSFPKPMPAAQPISQPNQNTGGNQGKPNPQKQNQNQNKNRNHQPQPGSKGRLS